MRTLCCLFPAAFLAVTLHVQAETLLPYGSTWKYLDDGSDQGTAWRVPGFDDSAWPSGPAQLGYGDNDEATTNACIDADPVASGVQRNATTYFRTTFVAADPSAYAALDLALLFDDAGAVYINGSEAARTANLPAGALYSTYATSTGADNAIQNWILPGTVLLPGTNTLAVEIHQAGGSSSDISFDLQLSGASLEVVRGPYLQLNNDEGVTVRWRTSMATNSVLRAGTMQGMPTIAVTNTTITTEHEVRLAGLQADTRYYYSIGTVSELLAGGDTNHVFMTAPSPGNDRPMHFWVLGDCGTANASEQAVRDAYYSSSLYAFNDMVLLLGDNAYNTGTDAEYQNAIFDMFPAVLRQSPVWSCLGNHETAQDSDGVYNAPYFDIFSFPTSAECGGYASGTERYFSWEFGNIHFISLDSQTIDPSLRANMLAWLENDLAANTRRWTIACWHHPPYTKGSHNSDTEGPLIWARENLLPRLEAAGVDLVLSGHSHSYERSWLIDGFYATPTLADSGSVIDSGDGQADGDGIYGKDYGAHQGAVYAVAGSSGKTSGGTLNHPVMFTSLNRLGSMVIDIDGNRLDARFLNSSGAIEDYFTIEKGPIVSLSAPEPDAAEYGPVTGRVSVIRSGSTTNPLSVQLEIGGTAPDSRYESVILPAIISAGETSMMLDIVPLPDAGLQGTQTVVFTAISNIEYRIGAASNAAVNISDTADGAPPMAGWHLALFGSEANNPAVRGDDIDPEGDGLPNLLEYALMLDPFADDGRINASMSHAGGTNQWSVMFMHDSSGTDVDLELEWTAELMPPDWIPVARSLGGNPVETLNGATVLDESGGHPSTVQVQVPADSPHAYLRWKAMNNTP